MDRDYDRDRYGRRAATDRYARDFDDRDQDRGVRRTGWESGGFTPGRESRRYSGYTEREDDRDIDWTGRRDADLAWSRGREYGRDSGPRQQARGFDRGRGDEPHVRSRDWAPEWDIEGGAVDRGHEWDRYTTRQYRDEGDQDRERDWERRGRRYWRQSDEDWWAMPGPHTGRGPRGYRRSDDRIREEISERLTHHGYIDASDIDVRVEDGHVYLEGTVDDRRTKRLAEDLAEDVRGVFDIHNRLRVRQQGSAGWDRTVGGSGTATRDETRTAEARTGRFNVARGATVVGIGGDEIGTVKEIGRDDFLVDRALQRDVFVPFSAVQYATGNRVVLNVGADDIDNRGWESPPLTGEETGAEQTTG